MTHPPVPGETPARRPDDALDVLDRLVRARHSCRAFRPDPVDRALIERILAVAQRTPSWCNAQPWAVTITGGAATEALRAGLLAHVEAHAPQPDIRFPRDYVGVYRDRRRACGRQLYDAVGVAAGDRMASAHQTRENFRLFGAPHVAIVTVEASLGPYALVDAGAFVTAFMLAAAAAGVATIAQAALATCAPFLREHLGLPEGRHVLCGISFGHADADHPANGFRTGRAGSEEVVTWRMG